MMNKQAKLPRNMYCRQEYYKKIIDMRTETPKPPAGPVDFVPEDYAHMADLAEAEAKATNRRTEDILPRAAAGVWQFAEEAPETFGRLMRLLGGPIYPSVAFSRSGQAFRIAPDDPSDALLYEHNPELLRRAREHLAACECIRQERAEALVGRPAEDAEEIARQHPLPKEPICI